MWRRTRLYYETVKYLKWKQIRYQLFYRVRNQIFGRGDYTKFVTGKIPAQQKLKFQESISSAKSFEAPYAFTFLNLYHSFEAEIDWNFSGFGKLWTYNLNYFEFLLQNGVTKTQGLHLIHDFISNIDELKDGLEPYPISLRIIFWIRFLLKHDITDEKIAKGLYAQTKLLEKNIEYHLLGNHLLENGFAFLFAAYFYNHKGFYKIAREIITEQLEEQVLPDGGHFELSPMYHQTILYRLLDAVNLVKNNPEKFQAELLALLAEKATLMLTWLTNMTFRGGSVPLLNDCAMGIAPKSGALYDYANRLNIAYSSRDCLKESGYRKIQKEGYEMIVDIGHIGPDYIPGHAHSDTFNFELHVGGQPFIVDTGTSTYEKNKRRAAERSTVAHNTVMVGHHDQSKVWGGFRVARRAKPTIIKDKPEQIIATHNGYKFLGLHHQRSFSFSANEIVIEDILSQKSDLTAKAFLHFHPTIKIKIENSHVRTNLGNIRIENALKVESIPFEYAPRFNQSIPSTKIVITFTEQLKVSITL